MVIPIFDEDPLERSGTPYVTYGLIALNVIVYVVQLGADDTLGRTILQNFALHPAALAHDFKTGGFVPPFATLLTYMFLHASWMHLLFNILFLRIFGDNIEDAIGRGRFLLFYLLCGIASALVEVIARPEATGAVIGASGAIAGVVGAYLMLRPCAKIEVLLLAFPLKLDAFIVIGLWVATQIWNIATARNPGIAWWSHVGGFAAGVLLVMVMRPAGVPLLECFRAAPPDDGGER